MAPVARGLLFALAAGSCLYNATALENSSACLQRIPLRAIVLSLPPLGPCDWACDAGYFRVPSSGACKVCTPRHCAMGESQRACTANADTACETCPSLLPTFRQYVVEGDCTLTRCMDGYWTPNATAAPQQLACAPCPVGSYCIGGFRIPCAAAETTLSTGSQSPFACRPIDVLNLGGNVMATIKFRIMLSGDSEQVLDDAQVQARLAALSLDVNADCQETMHLLDWVEYGSLTNCKLQLTYNALQNGNIFGSSAKSFLGIIHCFGTVGPSVMGGYISWLRLRLTSDATLLTQKGTNIAFVCLFRLIQMVNMQAQQPEMVDLSIGPTPAIYKELLLYSANVHAALKPPGLSSAPLPWGSTQGQVMSSVFAAVFSIAFGAIALTCTLTLLILQCRHKKKMAKFLENCRRNHELMALSSYNGRS